MRTKLPALMLVVALLGLPAMTAAADDAQPTPTTPTTGTPAPGTEESVAPSESPASEATDEADTNGPVEEPAAEEPAAEEPSTDAPASEEPAAEAESPAPQQRSQQRSAPGTNTPANVTTFTAHTAMSTGVGWGANVWGTATGAPNATVWTEVRIGSSWSRSQVGTTSATGSYVLKLTYGQNSPGTQVFRVGVATSGGTKYSPEVRLNRVSVSASTAGTAVVGAGANVWGTAAGAADTRVWVEARLPNGSWSLSQQGTSNGSAFYALPLTYGANSPGTQTFRVGVATGAGNVYSSPVTLTRVGSVTASTAGTKFVGERTNVWGSVSGGANAAVRVEVRLSNGTWSTSQIGRATSSGSYTLPLTYGQNTPGTYTYRVAATINGTTVYSPSVTLTRKAKPAAQLDSRCLSGRVMCASKKDRKLWWVIDGQIVRTFDARFGCAATPSDNGSFRVGWKSYNHTSTIYNVWMPRAMFYNGGEAVHYSPNFASVGYAGCSAGCVNIRDWNGINWLYDQVRVGDKVIVY